MCHELARRELSFTRQLPIPIIYEGLRLESGLRPDLVVGEAVIVEIKAVEALLPLFTSQLLTYLKLADLRLGLIINFDVAMLKYGIKRVIR